MFVTIGLWIVIFLLIYLIIVSHIEINKYKQKYIVYEKEIKMLSTLYLSKDSLVQNLITMIDSNDLLAMQIKDKNDQYIFANKTLLQLLFNNVTVHSIIGKTDTEILLNKKCEDINTIQINTIDDIKRIDYNSFKICNITDYITRSLNQPCRFYEQINDLYLDVYKRPILDDNNEIIATIGSLINVTSIKDIYTSELQKMLLNDQAIQISNSNNYYIKLNNNIRFLE